MPGVQWKSMKEFLTDVLRNLNNEQCRNYPLQAEPLGDVRILTGHHHNWNNPNLESVWQLAYDKVASFEAFPIPTIC